MREGVPEDLRARAQRGREVAEAAVLHLGVHDQPVRVVQHIAGEFDDVELLVADLDKRVALYKTSARRREKRNSKKGFSRAETFLMRAKKKVPRYALPFFDTSLRARARARFISAS